MPARCPLSRARPETYLCQGTGWPIPAHAHIVLQTSMTCSQEGKLAARLQNVKMCGRAHGPLLSLRAGKETWGGTSDSYFQNLRTYSLLTENAAAQYMVEASNMAALGVEVQGASIRLAKTVLTVVLTWQCAVGPLCYVVSLTSL